MNIIEQIEGAYFEEMGRHRNAWLAQYAYFKEHGKHAPHLVAQAKMNYPDWYYALSRYKDFKEHYMLDQNNKAIAQEVSQLLEKAIKIFRIKDF